MEVSTFVALSRQVALQRQMDVLANNIANVSTPAFKAQRLVFTEYFTQATAEDPVSYVLEIGQMRDTRAGPVVETEAPLDVALHGNGYLVVDTPSGQRYTRNGHLTLDADGRLVTGQGHPVLDENSSPIIIDRSAKTIEIARDGTVATDTGTAGRLSIVRFGDEQALIPLGDSLYETNQLPQPAPDPVVLQGMVEDSNVQPIVEITRMLKTARAYEATQRIIETDQQLQLQTIETLTQLS